MPLKIELFGRMPGLLSHTRANCATAKRNREPATVLPRASFDDLPFDVLVEIVRADPVGTFALIDTSRRCAEAVVVGALAALQRSLPPDKDIRTYVKTCMRAGRCPADLVGLSDALQEQDFEARLQRMQRCMVLPPGIRYDLCDPLLRFLCTAPVLIEAFQMRRHSILVPNEIGAERRMLGVVMPKQIGREIWSIDGNVVLLTGLDRVLLPFVSQLGPEAMLKFCLGQYDLGDFAYSNRHKPIRDDGVPGTWFCVARTSKIVGDSLLRYLSAEQVKGIADRRYTQKSAPIEDGPFCPIVAGRAVDVSVIDLGQPELDWTDAVQIQRDAEAAINAYHQRYKPDRECCVFM